MDMAFILLEALKTHRGHYVLFLDINNTALFGAVEPKGAGIQDVEPRIPDTNP